MAHNDSSSGIGASSGRRVTIVQCVEAVILYPSLLTPEIITVQDPLQLVILTKTDNLSAQNINWQLKFNHGINELKRYRNKQLFSCNAEICIRLSRPGDLGDRILQTNSTFNGRVDKRALKIFSDRGYTKVYNVNIFNPFNNIEGLFNLFWLYPAGGRFEVEESTGVYAVGDETEPYQYLNTVENGKIIPNEIQDKIIWEILEEMHGADTELAEGGKYSFQLRNNDIDHEAINLTGPLQSYHTVFNYKDKSVFNFAQLSDLHISSRQNYLCKSKARVIEYAVERAGALVEEDKAAAAPEIGPMVSICSAAIKELMDKIGNDATSDILLLNGDLIDYNRNVYQRDPFFAEPTIKQIWDKLALKDGDAYKKHYQEYVDYISIYTLILNFMKKYGKPVVVQRGNHDCYVEPYGTSPRAIFPRPRIELKRANEGIPADHNLTIYEACLAFGETFHVIKDTSIGYNENKLKRLPWFYSVLTPFADFVIKMPKQCLICLSWEDDEDIIGIFNDTGQGFLGHLPRSDNAVSDKQLELVKMALQLPARKFLMSHFTFVSYIEQIPFSRQELGDVEFDSFWDAGEHDMGTFETNRKIMYESYLAGVNLNKRPIDCVMSGHSHRRGAYAIIRADYSGDNSVKTKVMSLSQYGRDGSVPKIPAVIVTDSAGPLPRYNWRGEFDGWGSERPGGGKIICDPEGKPSSLGVISANPAPRFVVALDYWDVIAGDRTWPAPNVDIITKFETPEFAIRDEHRDRVNYSFKFWLNNDVNNFNVHDLVNIIEVYFYVLAVDGKWKKIQLQYANATNTWDIRSGPDSRAFRRFIATQDERAVFCSVKFSKKSDLLNHYNFDSHWNFEIQIDFKRSGRILGIFGSPKNKKYLIERDRGRAEKPDFSWRKKLANKFSNSIPKFR